MPEANYTYNPAEVPEYGISRMRFELGDTMTEGKAQTAALSDEEIAAAIEVGSGSWKKAKLFLLESLCRRFAYEVDTKTGPLSLNLSDRAKAWREDYEKLKKEVKLESLTVPGCCAAGDGEPYFYAGMQGNIRTKG